MSCRLRLVCLLALISPVLGLFVGCSPSESPAQSEAVETSQKAQTLGVGLIGHWRMDDAVGTIAADASSFGHVGLLEGGGIATWTTGKVAGGIALGGGRFFRVAPTPSLNAVQTSLTVSAWVYRTTVPSPADEYVFYRRSTSLGTVVHLLQGPGGHVCLGINASQTCTSPVSFGVWHHLVGTWDGFTRRIYVDGVEAASAPSVTTLNFDSSFSLHLGSSQGGALPWNGRLDEMRLYGRALDAFEVGDLYRDTPSNPYPAGQALMVVGEPMLSVSDLALRTRLTSLGFQVVVVDDSATVTADANGKSLVVVSETSVSSLVGDKFLNIAIPCISLEPSIYHSMRMAPVITAWDVEIGDDEPLTDLNFVGTHPLAAGLTGVQRVAAIGSKVVWARPTSTQVIKAATIVGDTTKAAIFGYPMGSTGEGGFVFPHRRIGFFAGALTLAAFTTKGWTAFDAAVQWAVQPHAALVVATGTLSVADSALKARIEGQGYAVKTIQAPRERHHRRNRHEVCRGVGVGRIGRCGWQVRRDDATGRHLRASDTRRFGDDGSGMDDGLRRDVVTNAVGNCPP